MSNIGALRPYRLTKFLPELGWKITVLTTTQDDWQYNTDSSLYVANSKHLRIVRAPRLPITRMLYRFFRKFGANPFWYSYVDQFFDWYPFAKAFGEKIIDESEVDLICATAPPYTSLRLARSLSKYSGIPAVADLRDPFSQSIYVDFPTTFHRRYYQKYEANLLKSFQHIIVAWPKIAEWNSKAFGIPISDFSVITNGFDPEDFKNRYSLLPTDDEFRIGFFGSIYGPRSVEPLFKALKRANKVSPNFKENSKVIFSGSHGSYDLVTLARKYNVQNNLVLLDFLPQYSEVLQHMSSCHVLVMFAGMVNESYPGKMYEYIASRRPILNFSKRGSLWDLVEDTKIGVSVEGTDVDKASKTLLGWFDRFSRKLPLHEFDQSKIERFDAFNLVSRFVDVFDSIY